MIKFTIADLLGDEICGIVYGTNDETDLLIWSEWFAEQRQQIPQVYVVRDGDVVFYVGQSRNPIERLLSHMGQGNWVFPGGKSSVGQMIEANLPDSLTWQIELLTPADCNASDVDDAEGALIYLYAPYLNIQGKRRRSDPLPERYKTPDDGIANEGVRLA